MTWSSHCAWARVPVLQSLLQRDSNALFLEDVRKQSQETEPGAAPRFSLQTEPTSRSSSFLRRGLWCPDSVTRAVWRGAQLRACRPSQQETDATSPSVAGTSSPWPEHPARSSNQSGSRRCCRGLCSSPAPHLPPALQRGSPVEPCAFLPLVFIIEMLLALNQQPVLRCQLWELVPGPWAFLASSCNAAVSPSFQSPSVFRGLVNTDSRRRPGSGWIQLSGVLISHHSSASVCLCSSWS